MAKWSDPVEIRLADLPQMKQFIGSVAGLLKTLARYDDLPLPEPVLTALDQLRRDVEALSAPPINLCSDEDRIRDAMTEAREHPGRTVTR